MSDQSQDSKVEAIAARASDIDAHADYQVFGDGIMRRTEDGFDQVASVNNGSLETRNATIRQAARFVLTDSEDATDRSDTYRAVASDISDDLASEVVERAERSAPMTASKRGMAHKIARRAQSLSAHSWDFESYEHDGSVVIVAIDRRRGTRAIRDAEIVAWTDGDSIKSRGGNNLRAAIEEVSGQQHPSRRNDFATIQR